MTHANSKILFVKNSVQGSGIKPGHLQKPQHQLTKTHARLPSSTIYLQIAQCRESDSKAREIGWCRSSFQLRNRLSSCTKIAPRLKDQTSNWCSCKFSWSRNCGTPRGSDIANASTEKSRNVHCDHCDVLWFWKPIVEETFVVMGPSYGREFDLSYNHQSSITLSISKATLCHSLYKYAPGSRVK